MATPYLGYSGSDWARSVATTLADHIRDVEEDWMRNYQLGALLEQNDRVSYNHGGRGFDWPIQYRIHNVEGNTGETVRNFARRNLFKTAFLPYRGYQATDAIFKRERLENRGEAAIVKLFEGFVERLEKSIKQGIATEWYVDGNATGNEQSWHGFESFLSATQTITSTSAGAVARSANAADFVCYPNDNYAGQSTVLGTFGGDQSANSTWPAGTADPEFDAWSPIIVNSTCSGFTSTTWNANCLDAMRYLIIHSQRNTSLNGQITNIFLNRDGYRLALTKAQTEEQIFRTPGDNGSGLVQLGFKNVFNFDGVDISWETGVPTNDPASTSRTMFGYGFNYNNIELRCMEDTIFKSEMQYDIDTQADKAVVYTLSNIKFEEIRNVGKLTSLA